jgi:hypothetical protein
MFKQKCKEINSSKESALAFYVRIEVLDLDGSLHKNYTREDRLPVRPN